MRVRFRSLDEIEGLQRMVKTIDVDLVAKSVAVFVRAHEQRIFVRLHIVIAVKVGVGADADMVDADQLCDMVDMVGHMPDLGWIAGANEHAHPADAHHPRSDTRRVGKECVRACKTRWSPYH